MYSWVQITYYTRSKHKENKFNIKEIRKYTVRLAIIFIIFKWKEQHKRERNLSLREKEALVEGVIKRKQKVLLGDPQSADYGTQASYR